MTENENQLHGSDSLVEKIKNLEVRLNRIESLLRIHLIDEDQQSKSIENIGQAPATIKLSESKIVESGLAWLGSIVFMLGIIFLTTFIENNGNPWLSKILAYTGSVN